MNKYLVFPDADLTVRGKFDEKIFLSKCRPVCEKDCKMKSYLFFPNADMISEKDN